MVIQEWKPFSVLRTTEKLWRGSSGDTAVHRSMEGWPLPLDVVKKGDDFTIYASLAGIEPEDIQVSIDDRVLTIKGQTKADDGGQDADYLMRERRAGAFYRALRLPDSLDTDKAHTSYEHGVLSITFPRLEAKKAKRLTINTGKSGALEGSRN
jgi:HSP20 family protein